MSIKVTNALGDEFLLEEDQIAKIEPYPESYGLIGAMASIVYTWSGRRLPVRESVESIRNQMSTTGPILLNE